MRTQYICQQCGKARSAYPSAHRRYCSIPCARRHQHGDVLGRFWKRVNKTATCWLWTGSVSDVGYGYLFIHRQKMYAHRLSYTLAFGPIPDGMSVCHNCPGGDRSACVNPAHLWLGSQTDNMHDMKAKGRASRGERSSHAKLTAEQVQTIRLRYAAGRVVQKQLAVEYGVSSGTICDALAGRTWRHLL